MKGISQGLFFLALGLLSACAKGRMEKPAPYAFQAESLSREAADGKESLPGTGLGQGRKLVKRAQVQIRVEDPEVSEQALNRALDRYGGYTASSRKQEHGRDYTIRVPAASYEGLWAELHRMGQVIRDSESAEDVSLSYYDLEGRLATKQELLKTFQSYLGKAKTIEEILSVEQRIGELQYEIEHLGTEFRTLTDQIQYATIELMILSPALASEPNLKERLAALYRSFGESLATAVVVFAGILLYGIPGVLVLGLLYGLLLGRIGLLRKLWRVLSEK
ncbi:MAG: DUF4349 domain-containing protein [Treponema sp.]|jgi:hypothetical protein|nr:DUF4349 domain-containing protein [Treponema sp.]